MMLTALLHQFLRQTESPVASEDANARHMSVSNSVGRLLLHLAKDVAYDPSLGVFGHVGQLRPGQGMVEVVSHGVVLWEVVQIARLHPKLIVDSGLSDIHDGTQQDAREEVN